MSSLCLDKFQKNKVWQKRLHHQNDHYGYFYCRCCWVVNHFNMKGCFQKLNSPALELNVLEDIQFSDPNLENQQISRCCYKRIGHFGIKPRQVECFLFNRMDKFE